MTADRQEDWPIKRRQGVGFTAPELATIRIGFENNRPIAEVARKIGASIRGVRRRYDYLRGRAIRAKKAAKVDPPKPAPAPPKPRFYKSNFEL